MLDASDRGRKATPPYSAKSIRQTSQRRTPTSHAITPKEGVSEPSLRSSHSRADNFAGSETGSRLPIMPAHEKASEHKSQSSKREPAAEDAYWTSTQPVDQAAVPMLKTGGDDGKLPPSDRQSPKFAKSPDKKGKLGSSEIDVQNLEKSSDSPSNQGDALQAAKKEPVKKVIGTGQFPSGSGTKR